MAALRDITQTGIKAKTLRGGKKNKKTGKKSIANAKTHTGVRAHEKRKLLRNTGRPKSTKHAKTWE